MNKEEKIVCIYKITSPSGKIYVGQTTNRSQRFLYYKKLKCKNQIKLYNSFLKHGVENHFFETICECNEDKLNTLEEKYVLEFKCVEEGLNLRYGGGCKGKLSEETKEKLRIINTGKKQSEESKIKNREANKGNKNGFYGKTHTEEVKKKISGKNHWTNRVLISEETRIKHSLSRKGLLHTPETKEKMRNSKLGIKRSPESIKKSADSKRGKKQSQETILKRMESRNRTFEERRIMIF